MSTLLVLPALYLVDCCLQNKQRWSWLALRIAREKYLRHFGAIGTGDVLQLSQEIENERERLAQEAANPAPKDKDDQNEDSKDESKDDPKDDAKEGKGKERELSGDEGKGKKKEKRKSRGVFGGFFG